MEDFSIGQQIVFPEWVQITNALNIYHKLSISLVHPFHNAKCPTFQVSLSSLSSLPTFSPSPCVWCASMSIIGPQFVHLNKPLWVVLPEHGKLFTKGFPLELAPSLTKGIPHLFTIPDQHWRRCTNATFETQYLSSLHLCMCSVHISSKWLIKLGMVSVAGKKKGEQPSLGHRSRLSGSTMV